MSERGSHQLSEIRKFYKGFGKPPSWQLIWRDMREDILYFMSDRAKMFSEKKCIWTSFMKWRCSFRDIGGVSIFSSSAEMREARS